MNDAVTMQEPHLERQTELKVFVLGPDWWIAADLEACKKVIEKEAGITAGDDYEEDEIEELADEAEIKIWCDPEDGDMPTEINGKGAHLVTRTAKDWAAFIGKETMLCSTEC